MVLSNNETDGVIGALRLGLAAVLALVWLMGGIALIWFGEVLFGGVSISIGLILLAGGYRLYRAIERPDVVRDERMKESQHRAGFNAFWSMVLVPSLCIAFYMFLPTGVTNQIEQWGGLELVWPVSLLFGFGVYLGSLALYRIYGL